MIPFKVVKQTVPRIIEGKTHYLLSASLDDGTSSEMEEEFKEFCDRLRDYLLQQTGGADVIIRDLEIEVITTPIKIDRN